MNSKIRIPTREDSRGNQVIPLSDGSSLDVRELKICFMAISQVYGRPANSVSDLPGNPLRDVFGEDDTPVSEKEIVEGVARILAQIVSKILTLRQQLKAAPVDRIEAVKKDIASHLKMRRRLAKFIASKKVTPRVMEPSGRLQ